MSLYAGQFGIAKETTYGTGVTVTRFVEHESFDLQGVFERVWTNGIRPSRTTRGVGDFLPVAKGAEGKFSFTPGVKSFGLFLELAMGSGTAGTLASGKYPHVFKRASATGKSFTAQVVRPYVSAGSDPAFTYTGCKVRSMTLSQSIDEFLMAEFDVVAQAETTATSTATASYASPQEYFNWNKVTITVGGSGVCASGWEVSLDNNLKADRFKMCSGGVMDEPIATGFFEDKLTLKGIEFQSLAHYNRVAAAVAADAAVAVVITLTGTADTDATLEISMPACVAMADALPISSGSLLLEQDLDFYLAAPSSGSTTQCQITYTTTDSSV